MTYTMNIKLYNLMDVLFKVLPLNKKIVYFSSFNGLYNDNPRYISEKLHELFPHVKIAWVIDNRAIKDDIPSYVIQLEPKSFKQVLYKNIAKCIVDNGMGLMYTFKNHCNFKLKFIKKKSQLDYSTWHGTPLKLIGLDVHNDRSKILFTSATSLIINSDFLDNLYQTAFPCDIPKKKLGSARNDLLFSKEPEFVTQVKQKLGLPLHKKMVLYAPTYRSENGNISGNAYSVYISKNEIYDCLNSLKKKFGGEWVFVYRVHQFVLSIVTDDIDNKIVFNGNLHDDMAEYLVASDAMITDYSSSFFDYTLTRKPCFLYVPDYDDYLGSRGFYFSLDELPYPYAKDIESLEKLIESFDCNKSIEKIKKFNDLLGVVDDGHASERIVQLMAKEAAF